MKIVTGTQMKKIDQQTIEYYGVTGLSLMETAGHAVYEEVLAELAGDREPYVIVVCGAGNNGGDGYVAARLLHEARIRVRVYSTVDPDRLTGDARSNYEAFTQLNLPVRRLDDDPVHASGISALESESIVSFGAELKKAAVIVDAIFGTGLSRSVTGAVYRVIEEINDSGAKVISVDIPSGVGGDDGSVHGIAVRADTTVTFQAPKLGCLIYPGASCTGNLVIQDIGIPTDIVEKNSDEIYLTDQSLIKKFIRKRERDRHKGDFGKVLVAAGSPGMAGAAAFCAKAALRSGAGLVRIAVQPEILDTVQMLTPEATCVSREDIQEIIGDHDAAVIGPGLGTGIAAAALVRGFVRQEGIAVVIDADGLNIIANDPSILAGARASLIITPHPGEAARLLRTTAAEINSDRIGSARRLTEKTGAVVVLKGAATVISLPDGRIFINPTGNPGMATGGSGDVLSGIIASFCGQGIPWEYAALAGVYLHGLAGDIMAEQLGEHGLIASDLNIGVALAIDRVIKGSA